VRDPCGRPRQTACPCRATWSAGSGPRWDAFNIFNSNTIQTYATNNMSLSTNTSPASLIAPRVFPIGAKIAF
jgi:hypothetical protein